MKEKVNATRTLCLTSAIIGTLIVIPHVGNYFNVLNIATIINLVLAIKILVNEKEIKIYEVSKVGPIMIILSVVFRILTLSVAFLVLSLGANIDSAVGEAVYLASAIALVIGTIFQYINFARLSR